MAQRPLPSDAIIAYKATDHNGYCRRKRYEVGKTYTLRSVPRLCRRGMHACLLPQHVLGYYNLYSRSIRLFQVAMWGATNGPRSVDEAIANGNRDTKLCSNKMRVLKELSIIEFFEECRLFNGAANHKNFDANPVDVINPISIVSTDTRTPYLYSSMSRVISDAAKVVVSSCSGAIGVNANVAIGRDYAESLQSRAAVGTIVPGKIVVRNHRKDAAYQVKVVETGYDQQYKPGILYSMDPFGNVEPSWHQVKFI